MNRRGPLAPELLVPALAGSCATAAGWWLLRRPTAGRWQRTNHAGAPVSLLEGPAYVIGSVAGALASGSAGFPVAVAGAAAGLLGAVDDLLGGHRADKGLRGHLHALREGRVTTGAVKVAGLAGTGLLAAYLADRDCGRRQPGTPASTRLGTSCGTLVGAAVLAGTANLLNLLDLRPGRALKCGLVLGAPLVAAGGPGAPGAAAVLAGAVVLLPDDLAARAMLGDTGANALGAMLAAAALPRLGTFARLSLLAVLAALTIASERVSFTLVIESTPVLRELDALGRADLR